MTTTIRYNGIEYSKDQCIKTANQGYVPKDMQSSIVKDCITGENLLKAGNLVRVITGKTGSSLSHGITFYKKYAVEVILSSEQKYVATEELAKKLGYVYDKEHHAYTSKALVGNLGRRSNELRFDYPPKQLVEDNKRAYGTHSSTFGICGGLRYTFGVEVETSKGSIPSHDRIDLPINSVYDGSIRDDEGHKVGTEYTTLPLYGDNGFLALKNSLTRIIKYDHQQNKSCSIHVHLGNANFNKTTVTALWALSQKLENELFSIMPKTRKTSEHCKKIKQLAFDLSIKPQGTFVEKYYEEMQIIVGGTTDKTKLSRDKQHPRGPKCQYDKSTPRYWWVNFVPAMFNMRENGVYTIEYRNHSASRNYNKIKNWIVILMAILNYAENYPHLAFDKKKITLKEIFEKVYSKEFAKKLLKYVEKRKTEFNGDRDAIEYTKAENRDFPGRNLKSAYV